MSGRSGDGRGGSILTPQIINQLALALGLLHKGDAVVVVSGENICI